MSDQRESTLGLRLRSLRQKSGLTSRELARRADVSPSLISQIENGKVQPSVATLYSFSLILGASVNEFFATGAEGADHAEPSADMYQRPVTTEVEKVSIIDPANRPSLVLSDNVMWERLAATPDKAVHFEKVTYEAGATSSPNGNAAAHRSYEFGYVLVGEIELTIGDDVFVLVEGQSFGFDATIPHVFRNCGEGRFTGLWFVHDLAS